MGILSGLFRGYRQTVGLISGAAEYHGDIKISIIVPKERIKELFTGKVDLNKLSNQHVKLSVPAIKTEKEEVRMEDRERKLRMKELHQESREIQQEMKEVQQA